MESEKKSLNLNTEDQSQQKTNLEKIQEILGPIFVNAVNSNNPLLFLAGMMTFLQFYHVIDFQDFVAGTIKDIVDMNKKANKESVPMVCSVLRKSKDYLLVIDENNLCDELKEHKDRDEVRAIIAYRIFSAYLDVMYTAICLVVTYLNIEDEKYSLGEFLNHMKTLQEEPFMGKLFSFKNITTGEKFLVN